MNIVQYTTGDVSPLKTYRLVIGVNQVTCIVTDFMLDYESWYLFFEKLKTKV